MDEGVEVRDDGLEIFVQLGEPGDGFDVGEVDFDAWDDLLLLVADCIHLQRRRG